MEITLYGGPHDGRILNLPEFGDMIAVPNKPDLEKQDIEDIDDVKPIIFNNSLYVLKADVDNMKASYEYEGNVNLKVLEDE